MEFRDFSRTSPKIQGLFKTVRTLLKSLYQKLVAILPRVSKVVNTGESQSPSPKDKIYISFPKMDKTGAFYLVRRRQAVNLFFVSLFEEESPGMKPIKLVTSDEWERSFYC